MRSSEVEARGGRPSTPGNAVYHPQRDAELYATFLKMRELLEDYAPCWYSDELREQVDTVMLRASAEDSVS